MGNAWESNDRPLCARGCSFYGSVENKNLCSKCYSDYLKEQIAKSNIITIESFVTSQPHLTVVEPPLPLVSAMAQLFLLEAPAKRTNRCPCCNKKLGLLGFQCKCGEVFCGTHRYPEEHNCAFDFKTTKRQTLAKELPLIKPEKLERI